MRAYLNRLVAASVLLGPLLLGQPPAPAGRSGGAQRVAPPARIVSFSAKPESVQAGQAVVLTWATENPAGLSIEPDLGRVTPRGTRQVFPAATTTYTLTVGGPNSSTL